MDPTMPKLDPCEASLARVLDIVTTDMRGIAGPREYAAFAAGFRIGWKARTARREITRDQIRDSARRPDDRV
jgi:hypothetical protein